MHETSLSLLNRLQESPDSESWSRLVHLYTPLIRIWLRKFQIQDNDAEDLLQEVLLSITKDIGTFEHGGQSGAFRAWVRAILVNRLRNFWRNRDRRPQTLDGSNIEWGLAQLEDPGTQITQLWNRQHDRYVLAQLMNLVEPYFESTTWEAFRRVAMQGQKPQEVAAELGISLNSVFTSKSRVMRRLRQEANGLIESSSNF